MKTITRMELQPGMVLAEDVTDQGRVLYPAGTTVTQLLIDRLGRYAIMCVTIMEKIDFATTHHERIRCDVNFQEFEKEYTEKLLFYKSCIQDFMVTGKRPADAVLLGIYYALSNYIASGNVLLDYLYSMFPNEDELTYTHCLNSALLAGTFADWMQMKEAEKNTLILCGFYYDIGKLHLPYELLWKPGSLTEEEYNIVRQHPLLGYERICNEDISVHVKNAVLMHHERADGSGYPNRLCNETIDIYARYIAIIDTYIAMASCRTYRDALTPLYILSYFQKNLSKYDVQLLMPLCNKIANAQIGSSVQLNDDSVWEIMLINPQDYYRPFLKNDSGSIINLLTLPDLEIVKNV